MELTVKATGDTLEDLALAMEEALRRVRQGFTSGGDQNETGRFHFELDGEEVGTYALRRGGHLLAARHPCLDEAREAARPGDRIVGLAENGRELIQHHNPKE